MKTDYYVYAYLDPQVSGKFVTPYFSFTFQPLYIGKGREERMYHGKIALIAGKYLLTNKMLYGRLCSLSRSGFDPVVVLIKDNLSAQEALDMEGQLIEQFGRLNKDPGGILFNRRKQGEIPDPSGLSKDKAAMLKMKETRMKNGSYYTGADHAMAKTFQLQSPTGEVFSVCGGLKKFCASHNLSWQTLYSHIDQGPIVLDRSKHKNIARLTERFWNTLGWSIQSPTKV